ncbi:MAG: hypothetical protein KJ880_02025 [Candidatus Omnitrophica bacterium]|nr:hypothetical protein [Candidatus Omnitrophota bacterium]MBU1869257.1 hypothetical protein [Candidatus Omnitrophota bacterium]
MEEKKDFYQAVEEIYIKDTRYKPDAYEFLIQALHFTQKKFERSTHVSGKELLEGIKDFAIQQYGPMVKTVFSHWGIAKTEDFGSIVFNMVDNKLLSKTQSDTIEDFKDVYDFDSAFGNVLRDCVICKKDDHKKDS